jgi:hypothetical protein
LPLDGRNLAGLITYAKQETLPAQTPPPGGVRTHSGCSEDAVGAAAAPADSAGGGGGGREGGRSSSTTTTVICRYVHTLNLPSGFRRKLGALGLVAAEDARNEAFLQSTLQVGRQGTIF